MTQILLGTCGWSYAEWEGLLYPQKQPKLKQYTTIFPTVEVDSTFYSMPKVEIVLGWVRHTPSDFIFSAKLPQTITHKKVLSIDRGVEIDLKQFLEVMKPLVDCGKLVCILVQLPPFLRFNAGKFEAFLSALPEHPGFAIEFRHPSWMNGEAFKLLEKYQTAYTIVDEPLLQPEVHVTSNLAYIRWHGRGSRPWFNYKYSEKELQDWIPKVKETADKAEKVLGYFNNHFHGYAPENCLQMLQMLGIVTPHRTAALRRLTLARRSRKPPVKSPSLETWIGPSGPKKMDELLLSLANPEALQAAQSISDDEFSLREDSKRRLAAYIGDTTVDIDLEKRTIVHFCPIWSESVTEKKLCPHVVKLFNSLDPEKGRHILGSIQSTLVNWKFESRLAVDFPR